MKKLFALFCVLMVVGIALLFSLSTNPNVKKSTVKDIKENAVVLDKNDDEVQLVGTIASQISKKKFWFEDKTGQIVIEIKNSLLPLVPSTNQVEVEIRGLVDCETEAGEGVKINVSELIFDNEEEIQLM